MVATGSQPGRASKGVGQGSVKEQVRMGRGRVGDATRSALEYSNITPIIGQAKGLGCRMCFHLEGATRWQQFIVDRVAGWHYLYDRTWQTGC